MKTCKKKKIEGTLSVLKTQSYPLLQTENNPYTNLHKIGSTFGFNNARFIHYVSLKFFLTKYTINISNDHQFFIDSLLYILSAM